MKVSRHGIAGTRSSKKDIDIADPTLTSTTGKAGYIHEPISMNNMLITHAATRQLV
jgi:hypothetical protein